MIDSWSHPNENKCPCQGSGWIEIDLNIYKECSIHFTGQSCNRDSIEELRRKRINSQISSVRQQIVILQDQVKNLQKQLVELELELINNTPTLRLNVPILQDEEIDISDSDEDI